MARESLIVYIDAKKKATLKREAKAQGRSLSNYAGRILEERAKALEEGKT
jgi:predicted HicB family RNase H-like nuclease